MARHKQALCDHQWARDDATSKVCVRCKSRAPIKEGN